MSNYYISSSGLSVWNSSTDLAPTNMSQFIANVASLTAGDKVYFKRGDTFALSAQLTIDVSGTLSNKIVFDAYGFGNRPIITSVSEVNGWTTSTNWSLVSESGAGPNIWKMSLVGNRSMDRCWINNVEVKMAYHYKLQGYIPTDKIYEVGDNGDGTAGVCAAHPFYFDNTTNILYIYSPSGNPASNFTSIKQPGVLVGGLSNDGTIKIKGSFLEFNNLDIQGSYYSSVIMQSCNDNLFYNCIIGKKSNFAAISNYQGYRVERIEISNCEISSEWNYDYIFYTQRTPYGVTMTGGASYWKIHDCLIKDWWMNVYVIGNGGSSDLKNSQYHDIYNNEITSNCSFGKAIQISAGGTFGSDENTYVNFHNNYVHDIVFGVQISASYNYFYYNIFENLNLVSTNEHSIGSGGMIFQSITDVQSASPNNLYVINNTFINTREYIALYDANPSYFLNNLIIDTGSSRSTLSRTNNSTPVTYNSNIFYKTNSTATDDLMYIINVGIFSISEFNSLNGQYNKTILNNIHYTGNLNTLINPDLSLPSGSIAINSGVNITGYIPVDSVDMDGNIVNLIQPSIGAKGIATISSIEAPTNLTGIVNGNSISLSWTDNSNNEAEFIIEKLNNLNFIQIASTTGTSYIDADLINGNYTYRVYARNSAISSGYSNQINLIVNVLIPSEIINDSLMGSTLGNQIGGSFVADGFKPGIGNNHILYAIDQQINNGYIEFEFKNFSNSDLVIDDDHVFAIMYDGRGITEPISYNNYKENYFRNYIGFSLRSTYNKLVTSVNLAAPTPARLDSTSAIFTDATGNNDGTLTIADRDYYEEYYAGSYIFNASTWYKIKIEWNEASKTVKYYINDVLKADRTYIYPYLPKLLRIWLGSGPGTNFSSKSANIVYKNFKLINNDAQSITYNAPEFITHPINVNAIIGENVNLYVNASLNGEGSIAYQWIKLPYIQGASELSNSSKYSGVTTNSLTISNVDSLDSINYACIIYNSEDPDNTKVISNGATIDILEESLIIYGSDSVFYTPVQYVVPIPIDLEATIVNTDKINISFKPNTTEILSYSIEYSTNGINFTEITLIQGSGISNYTINYVTSALSNGTYYFRVRAKNGQLYSDYTSIVSAIININITLVTPTNLQSFLSGNSINLSWENSDPESNGVSIEYSYNSEPFKYLYIVPNSVFTYTHSNLEDGPYVYRIRSYRNFASGTSIYSEYAYSQSVSVSLGPTVSWIDSGLKINSNMSVVKTSVPPVILYNNIISSNSFSLEAIVSNETIVSNGYYKRIITSSNDENNINFALMQNGNKYAVAIRGTLTALDGKPQGGSLNYLETSTGTASTLPSKTHIVVTYNGSALNIYLNGVLNASLSGVIGSLSNWNPTYNISIGDENNPIYELYNWKGSIFLLALYNRALTQSQITQNYNVGDI